MYTSYNSLGAYLTNKFYLIGRYGRIDLFGIGINAAHQIPHLCETLLRQKGAEICRAKTMMTHNNSLLVFLQRKVAPFKFLCPEAILAHGQMKKAWKTGNLQFGGLSTIDELYIRCIIGSIFSKALIELVHCEREGGLAMALDLDKMPSEFGVRLHNGAWGVGEGGIFKLLHHCISSKPAEIAALCFGRTGADELGQVFEGALSRVDLVLHSVEHFLAVDKDVAHANHGGLPAAGGRLRRAGGHSHGVVARMVAANSGG